MALQARKVSSKKRAGAKGRVPKMKPKFAPRCGARAIWKSKSLKTGGVGAFFEFETGKTCTTPVRESGPFFEVQSAFRVASAGISTQHPHENR